MNNPRIGRQIPHYEAVEIQSVDAVFSSDKLFRYLLSMRFRKNLIDTERNKSVVVILKNPSAADEKLADATIRKVETFVYNRFTDAGNLHIVNIFAFRATEPGDLNSTFASRGAGSVVGPENDHVIMKAISDADYIIIAWGNNSGIDKNMYGERVFTMKQLLRQTKLSKIYHVAGTKKTIQPLHGLMWGYNYSIEPAIEFLQDT